ncbi:transposase [Blautia obeum]|uniref:RNA-guided endonuclease InsQ/TnpB family protein n=3 Tax=Blautia obeum TaxID=40520 RepID=UPI00319E931B
MRKINRAVKIRICPNAEQRVQIEKTIGCSRFIYNCMLADKMEHYKKEKKMLRNTPASYKKEYPWLKEVDSLALANVQMHLESAFHKFFREPFAGFPRFKSKKSSRKSYTTNVVNGNIFLEGKYFASLLFCCENQTAEKRPAEKFIGIDFAMQGMCVFSTGKRAEYPMFYRNTEKKLAREQRKLSRCQKGSQNYKKQKKRVALCHEKIRNQRKDFQHKLSASLAESFDAVCVEDLNLKGMAGGLHLGKGVHDNGYGLFLSMLEYKLEERGKYLIKVDRYFASSKICSVCGNKKEELSLSDRIYYCECGNRMDRDVNAAVNIMNEGKRIFAECA